MKKVFISSPYTLGDTAANVRAQHDAFAALLDLGFTPFAPLLSHYQQLIHPVSWAQWIRWDFEWIAQCNVVLRLPGESRGAELECARARELLLPVITSQEGLQQLLTTDLNEPAQKEAFRVLVSLLHPPEVG